ncbi:DNRLRE domain-containing protein [Streptomyces sp. NPDC005388]|uniref:DNRLRE domain-containing protein n=1 Tax=Streptomyces sp. NPDC005388 TaxID=3156717 RepID=UPI0033A3EB4D
MTVDPAVNIGTSFDTFVQQGYATDQSTSTELKLGNNGSSQIARSFLSFPMSSIQNKVISAATLNLYEFYSWSCTAKSWEVWSTGHADTSTTWTNQPTWGTKYATSTATKGYSSSCDDGWTNTDVTSMVQAWAANGNGSNHLGIRATDETDAYGWKRFNSGNAASGIPSLSVTYNTRPSLPTLVAPADGASTNDTTPALQSTSTDADGNTVKVLYEIYDSTATTKITSGYSPYVTSGTTATWSPTTALAPGTYKWHASSYDGANWWSAAGGFTGWRTLKVDATAPGNSTVDSTGFPANTWSGTADADGNFTGSFTFTPPGSDVASVAWQLDGGTWTTTPTTGAAFSKTLAFRSGKHTLIAKTHDAAGNVASGTTYVFYAGDGAALTAPGQGERPARRASLMAQGQSTYTGVTYQYRRGEADTTWHTVPAGDVTKNSDGSTLSSWPVAVTGGLPPQLTWNITTSLSQDGPVDVRAQFTDGTATYNTLPNTVTVDRNAGTAPSEDVGPGSVNLLTGDYGLSATDASVFDMSISRTFSSRRPTAGADADGQVAIFGPSWTSGTVAEISESDWSYITTTSGTSLALVDANGEETGFALKSPTAGTWTPEPGAEDLTLTGKITDTTLVLKDTDGTTTTFAKPSGASTWQLSTTQLATSNSTTTVVPDTVQSGGKIRPKYVIAPTSAATAAACQTAPATKGCRMLEFVYATSTSASGSTLGNYTGQVSQIKLWATTPGDGASTASVIAQYAYDTAGNLREAWDPRDGLKTAYTYDGASRVATLTPPGELPWTFTYGTAGSAATAGDGMLLKVARPSLVQGSLDQTSGTTEQKIVYDVPLTDTRAPYAMGASDVAAWGQTDVPTDATAVFPADATPVSNQGRDLNAGDYTRATVTYADASGREVNTATAGGKITATEYDRFGNTVRELTASNRELALGTADWQQAQQSTLGIASLTTAERAQKLSTVSIYSSDGQRELEEVGPIDEVTLGSDLAASGTGDALSAGTQVAARAHTVTSYDQGRPTDGSATVSDHPTTVTTGAAIEGYTADADTRTSTTAYDWIKGLPTQTVDDPGTGHLNITKTTTYDSQGRVTKTTLPKSSGTDAGATVTTYWSASGTGTCNGHFEWADLVCSTGPAGAITGGGSNPTELPTNTVEYDRWGNTAKVTETANGTTRTTTNTYDAAGRVLNTAITGGVGTAVADSTTTYTADSGDVATVTDGTTTITRAYDKLGRQVSYKDGTGNTAVTEYDAFDRPVKVTDSAPSTTTYTYDHTLEPRGMATSMTDSVAGTFTAAYDADGNLSNETLPGGTNLSVTRDQTGAVTGRIYRNSSQNLLASDTTEESVHGQVLHDSTTTGGTTDQHYTYDAIGRLTQTDDTRADNTCTRRAYTFDNNTNRTGLTTSTSATGSACTSTGATTVTSTYDSADRLTTAGTAYDAFGRTTTQVGGATLAYYTNDLVRQETAGSTRQTWTLDAAKRLASWTTESNSGGTWTTTATRANHYGSDTDSPDWTQEATGALTRNVQDLTGDLAATTTATDGTVLQLTNIHGDVNIQLPLDTTVAPTVLDTDEYGNPLGGTATTRYGWLGSKQRSAETPSGLTLMGVRLYDPTTGRFLSTDPVPGGNANAYEYCNGDPLNCYDLDGRFGFRKWWRKHRLTVLTWGFTIGCSFATGGWGALGCATVSGAVIGAANYRWSTKRSKRHIGGYWASTWRGAKRGLQDHLLSRFAGHYRVRLGRYHPRVVQRAYRRGFRYGWRMYSRWNKW